uniref:Uncharacterized protein n=1 Tax=viral metagenome TaxID=1070528 RepID=A0A6H1ZTG8_9ZZZZ
MQVNFEALIKKMEQKSLVSLDKECRLTLQFQADDDIIDKINRLHKPDELVNITISKVEE